MRLISFVGGTVRQIDTIRQGFLSFASMAERSQWIWKVDEPGLDVEAILGSPAKVIKKSAHKIVTRHEWGGSAFYVKRYLHYASLARPVKFLFKKTQAAKEWLAAEALKKVSAPAVQHVALGERTTWWGALESVLITREFPGVPINQWTRPDWTSVRQFIGSLHHKGVFQSDLHPENILVNPETGDMRLVDLHGVRVMNAVPASIRKSNFAYLGIFVPIPLETDEKTLRVELRRNAHSSRSARALRQNRDFGKVEAKGICWQVRHEHANGIPAAWWREPDLILQEQGQLLKNGRSATVGGCDQWILKRYNFKKPLNLFKDLVRRSKAASCFQKAYHLELVGIPTARCIAAGERRKWGALLNAYLLMEKIPGENLGVFISQAADPKPVLKKAVALIAQLHEEGFSHRDLKETNLLVTPKEEVVLIDLDGVAYQKVISNEKAASDLDRFCRGVSGRVLLKPETKKSLLRVYCRTRKIRTVPRR